MAFWFTFFTKIFYWEDEFYIKTNENERDTTHRLEPLRRPIYPYIPHAAKRCTDHIESSSHQYLFLIVSVPTVIYV